MGKVAALPAGGRQGGLAVWTPRWRTFPSTRAVPAICAATVSLTAVAMLGIWLLRPDLKGFVTVTMKANTALALLAAAGSLCWSPARWSRQRRRPALALSLALLTLTIGLATLLEYLSGWNLGLDQALVTDLLNQESQLFPGRMSPIAAGGFVLLGASLAALAVWPQRSLLANVLAAPLLFVALLTAVGYLYGVRALYTVGPYIRIAWQTSSCLGIMAVGILACHPEQGTMRQLSDPGSAGMTLRRLLPAAIGIPIGLGFLGVLIEHHDLFGPELGTALLVLANVAFFFAIVRMNAGAIASLEGERQRALDAERFVSEQLSSAVAQQKRALVLAARLQDITASLSRATTAGHIAEVINSAGREAMAAQRSLVMLKTSDGWLEIAGSSGIEGATIEKFGGRMAPDGPLLIQQAARTGETLFVESLDQLAAVSPQARTVLQQTGNQSLVAMPFLFGHDVRGVAGFGYDEARPFAEEERGFIRVLAEQCGQAVERVRLIAGLEEAVRSRDEFISIASHELKTPLTSLLLRVEGMKRGLARGDARVLAPERVERLVVETDQQSRRLGRLVEDMLDVSRIRSGRLTLSREKIDLGELVREVVARMLPQLAAQGAEPTVDVVGVVVGAWDRLRLEQVVTNLLSNAARYGCGRTIQVSLESDGARALLRVRDHGIGLAEGDLERIFEPFERAASTQAGGLGLGLFIARQIVGNHGGRIWVEAAPGEGATFFVELPVDIPAPLEIVAR